ncbi:diketogulonate reductase-like aldo/keto reductase [Actinomadura viridis]|uniref:Diketogulonate reductase-like aldo/keto reductase n=1 Tax=Actinomadura viridis TaxID=58110 RepID=A0A931DEF5_9ACTN|nr:diketogulonate reductase-like aldo/keto reductase [Actinomadura viridis]
MTQFSAPTLYREIGTAHFDTYLPHWPLDAPTARHALDLLVNIARLLIRTRDANGAHHLLNALFHAVRAPATP